MSSISLPSTPKRKLALSPPRTPTRPRVEHSPMTIDSPDLVTPMTPTPVRGSQRDQELKFPHRVARRLFFTPQSGSQSYIPPSPPLTPTTPMSAAQSEFAKVPVHVVHHHIHVHHHPYPSTAPLSATTSEFDLEFVLGSPAGFRKAKKARRDF